MSDTSYQQPMLDPVFKAYGMDVYTYDYIEYLREDNLKRKRDGKRSYNLIPQKGFQETVLRIQADIKIIGGKRGSGKTHISLEEFLPYIFNPDVSGYGFRKLEDDVRRGIWKSSKPVFRDFGSPADASFEWKFLGGRGATFKCEHLQDPSKIKDRFRGVEMAYIVIEELAEHTKDSLDPLFDLLTSNRSTAGVTPKCVCTCNPVGKSNKLRYLLDWYIDPDTDRIIPERSGHIRYFYRLGNEMSQFVWGDTWEEVYTHPSVQPKVDALCLATEQEPRQFITSLVFIDGDFKDNKILHISDPKYMSRITAKGGESTFNDVEGIWRDIDTGESMLTLEDMERFFTNSEQRDGTMRASADVALSGDLFVIYALDGRHITDVGAFVGIGSDQVVPFVKGFLRRNGVREENFAYDVNGLGLWLKDFMPDAKPFNNKSAPSDRMQWANLKSEAAEKFVKEIRKNGYSIDEKLLERTFKDAKGRVFTLRDRLMSERLAIQRKGEGGVFEIIPKTSMKAIVGHSPDFIEGLFMIESLFGGEEDDSVSRDGYDNW